MASISAVRAIGHRDATKLREDAQNFRKFGDPA